MSVVESRSKSPRKATRTLYIPPTRVAKQDLSRLAQAVFDAYTKTNNDIAELRKDGTYYSAASFGVSIWSSGDVRTDIRDLSFLDDGDIVDIEKIKKISASFYSSTPYRRITVSLEEGDRSFQNEITITADDEAWVTITFSKIELLVNAIQPQTNFYLNNKGKIQHAFRLFLGYILYKTFNVIMDPVLTAMLSSHFTIETPFFLKYLDNIGVPRSVTGDAITAFISYLDGIFPTYALMDWIDSYWPRIEFDFGPEHMKVKKGLRSRATAIALIFIIPILINLFSTQLTAPPLSATHPVAVRPAP